MKIPSQNRLISFSENTKVTHLGTKWTGAEFEERGEGLWAARVVQGEVAGGTGRMCRGRGEGGKPLCPTTRDTVLVKPNLETDL